MKLSVAQLDADIEVTKRNIEAANASANKFVGALSVLEAVRAHLLRKNVKQKPQLDISPENEAIQRQAEALLNEVRIEEPQPDFNALYQNAEMEAIDANR